MLIVSLEIVTIYIIFFLSILLENQKLLSINQPLRFFFQHLALPFSSIQTS